MRDHVGRSTAAAVSRRAVLAGALGAAGTLALSPAGAQARDTTPTKSGPISVAYVEVNNDDLINVKKYRLTGGAQVFDIATIFAANINAGPHQRSGATLFLNDRVTHTLRHASRQIRPLQAVGIKVCLSILGNHQGVGIANFASPADADGFARQVAKVVHRYGLDGVDLDDEYSDYGVNGTAQPNNESIGWLICALRARMPRKLITFYNIGPARTSLSSSDPSIGSKIDYAWNPYYGTYEAPSIPGMTDRQYSAAAIDIQQTSSATAASLATRTVADGYGVFLTYNLDAVDRSDYISAFTVPLYGQATRYRP